MIETPTRLFGERSSAAEERRPALLLVEDNRADATLVRLLMEDSPQGRTFDMVHAPALADAITRLREATFACVLLDLGLPDADGIGSVRAVRAEAPWIPLVVLTGDDDELRGIEALHSGAQDYLVKGQVDGRLLTRTVCFAIERARMDRDGTSWQPVGTDGHGLPFDMSF